MKTGPYSPTAFRPLSPSQLEVMRLTCKGHTSEEIGELLGMTMNAVRARRHVAYQKLHAANQVAACVELIRQGLLDADEPG